MAVRGKEKQGQVAASTGVKRRRDAEATRGRLLQAAAEHFAAQGLEARIEDIADAAGTTRALAYYYFDSKEGLYLAALEAVFMELLQKEQAIDVDRLDPRDAIARLVRAKFDHYRSHPLYLKLLAIENLNEARFIERTSRLEESHQPVFAKFEKVLEKGYRQNIFKRRVDAAELYISMVGLGYYGFSNQHTLRHTLGFHPTSDRSVRIRQRMVVDMILAYLTNPDPGENAAETARP